jgi:homocysteine S-methyltransferase
MTERFPGTAGFLLSEASIYERLRRHEGVQFDPDLAHASLVYDRRGADLLALVHREYLDVGQRHGVPMIAFTDTWRASAERIQRSAFRDRAVNEDNTAFLREIRTGYGPTAHPIYIGGQIGPRGDGYRPGEAPPADEAQRFHSAQLERLAAAGVDFLYAATLPAFEEARGIARGMAAIGLPYVLSFVLRPSGTLLDGTPLERAVDEIDATTSVAPTAFAVNCVHPAVFLEALTAACARHAAVADRILSFQANASSLSPEELDRLAGLDADQPEILASGMIRAHEQFRTRILGGCCGTDVRLLEQLAIRHAARCRTC